MSYEDKKTPFFQVFISDSKGSKFIPLPYQVHRLIEKVEIKEIFGIGYCVPGQFTIHFLEGSREPFNTNTQQNTSEAYPMDSTGAGSLTNNTGMLADLRYIDGGGEESITALAASVTGLILDNISDIPVEVPGLEVASKDTSKLVSLNKNTTSVKAPKFLFQQRNQMKIVWGYIEDPNNRRSVIGYINGVDMDYPENDHPKLKVISVDTALHFDQVSSLFGTGFFKKSSSGITFNGDPIESFENISVKDLIEKFSSDAKMATPIISDEFADITLDKYAFNIIPAGMSPNQYFGELSKKYDAFFKVHIDPTTKKDTIVFLSRKEYNSKLLSNDVTLLTYKNPGSIIKSIQIRAEYGVLNGHAKSYVNEKGEQVTVATKKPIDVGIIQADAQYIDSDPTGNNPVQASTGTKEGLNTPYTIGSHDVTPEGNDQKTIERQVNAKAQCHIDHTVMISMSTLGFAKFRPGPWYVGGLGQRYSGTYYFKEVTHTLDANSYVCSMVGSNASDFLNTGAPGDGTAQTQKVTPQVDTALFKTTSESNGSASDKFNKNQDTY